MAPPVYLAQPDRHAKSVSPVSPARAPIRLRPTCTEVNIGTLADKNNHAYFATISIRCKKVCIGRSGLL
jgi:hypothetical protein